MSGHHAVSLLLAGLPGAMCREVLAAACECPAPGAFRFLPVTLTSEGRRGTSISIHGHRFVALTPSMRDGFALESFGGAAVAVDFSTPHTAVDNARWYCARGIPFVMGTTGFDRREVERLVSASTTCAVVAANMAAPLVALQAALEWAAGEFPGALAGLRASITESHQAAKRDKSGTARAWMRELARLGAEEAGEAGISSVRDPARQRALGVPEAHLGGHALHDVALESAAGDLALGWRTRVLGRRVYAEGALRAAVFLAARADASAAGRVFTMADVLRG
ncbi:MAG: dihydrodipicolinate reductase C-terminal domain-containing protein [Candidatus Sumerlaeia bacterium]|nr:dihydrodipicolinate reductase C-terminal domain-containing protein [Candidatus Sumerlaeia bacterium]